ncbi:MAG: TonB-dependent receptor [Melioribacteraceae bacterium]|nr:TonB-dependent receptor [Melioribacteraceae bacterium]
MWRNSYQKILLVLVILIFTGSVFNEIHAQQTGKISGIVKDSETGESLIGVNIYIQNQNIGAASDLEGYFAILNIHPGKYQVVASMVGYRKVIVNDVNITSGRTTNLDFIMKPATTELDEEVVVTAKRIIIKRDLTSSELTVSAEEIANLPVENLNDIITQKAGVVQDAYGNIHIRGGRSSEVGYLVDGISVKDNFTGARASEVDVQFMQEVKIISGVFNAEYGQAMSGIIDVITKRGSDKFTGGVSLYSGGYVSTASNIFYNIKDFNPISINDIKTNISGPVSLFNTKFNYSFAARRYQIDGWLYGQRRFNTFDSSYSIGNNFFIDKTGDNEIVSMNNQIYYNLQAKLNFDLSNKLKISNFILWDNSEGKGYNHLYKYNPDGVPTNYKNAINNILNLTYVFSSSSFLTLKYSLASSQTKTFVFKDINDSRYANPELLRQLTSYSFLTGGTDMTHDQRETITNIVKLDFLSQFDKYNEFKSGFEYRHDKIDVINETARYNGEIPVFSFNRFINEGKFLYTPISAAFYIQDKIEYKSIIINAGLRFDYFDSQGEVPLDYLNPETSEKTAADVQTQISPRVGVAFPISADGTIHFSYGHFFKIPDYQFLYYNPNFRVGPGGLYTLMGNANLKAESTIAYELGLHYKFFDMIGLEVIGFYKDISNLLGTEIMNTSIGGDRYAIYTNRDYGKSRGITFSLFKRTSPHDPISISIDYTYQSSQSNASNPNDAFNRAQGNPPKQPNIQVVPVSWDQRHTINLAVFYTKFNNYNIGLIAKYESGFPFTPENQSIQTSFENSARMPNKINVDLQIDKRFRLFNQQFSIFLKVYNLFDTRNEVAVYNDTGRAGYSLISQYTPEEQGANTLTEFLTNPTFYSEPRRIIVGLNFQLNFQ